MKFYNPFRPHIVQFRDGNYAIRKISFLYLSWAYKDLEMPKYWWPFNTRWFRDCTTTDVETLKPYINVSDYGTRI